MGGVTEATVVIEVSLLMMIKNISIMSDCQGRETAVERIRQC